MTLWVGTLRCLEAGRRGIQIWLCGVIGSPTPRKADTRATLMLWSPPYLDCHKGTRERDKWAVWSLSVGMLWTAGYEVLMWPVIPSKIHGSSTHFWPPNYIFRTEYSLELQVCLSNSREGPHWIQCIQNNLIPQTSFSCTPFCGEDITDSTPN